LKQTSVKVEAIRRGLQKRWGIGAAEMPERWQRRKNRHVRRWHERPEQQPAKGDLGQGPAWGWVVTVMVG